MAATRRKEPRLPAIEWITAAAGLAIVLGSIGFIAYGALAERGSLPALELSVVGGHDVGGGYATIVRVRNTGSIAAINVLIEGTLRRAGELIRSEARLEYVPGRSDQHATLLFPVKPESDSLDLRVSGYTTP